MAPLACRCYRARSANFLFFLPLGLLPLAFCWPSYPPSTTMSWTVSLTAAAPACMHACMVTAFPRLDLSLWYAMHWQVPRGVVAIGQSHLRPQSYRAINSTHAHFVRLTYRHAAPRNTRLSPGAGSCVEGGGEVIGPRPHTPRVGSKMRLGWVSGRGVFCGI